MEKIKFWFKRKFNNLLNAGIKYYGINFIFPIALPFLIVLATYLCTLPYGSIPYSKLSNIILNTMLQFMYLSLITFISILQNIIKNKSDNDDFLKNPDFWISISMLFVFIVFYGIQVYQSFTLDNYSIWHLILIFIIMSVLLYFAISIYSEYSEDSESVNTKPSTFANNREQQDNNDNDWESRL